MGCEHHRIVRAEFGESAPDALRQMKLRGDSVAVILADDRMPQMIGGESAPDALRQMKLRGDSVAVILADDRMPQMIGIEFLERAMDVYPVARRAPLTAYAHTGAAIDAINVVDLDHYLLKPWDPPEENRYPVVDGLLEAWLASDHRQTATDSATRTTSTFSPRTSRLFPWILVCPNAAPALACPQARLCIESISIRPARRRRAAAARPRPGRPGTPARRPPAAARFPR